MKILTIIKFLNISLSTKSTLIFPAHHTYMHVYIHLQSGCNSINLNFLKLLKVFLIKGLSPKRRIKFKKFRFMQLQLWLSRIHNGRQENGRQYICTNEQICLRWPSCMCFADNWAKDIFQHSPGNHMNKLVLHSTRKD